LTLAIISNLALHITLSNYLKRNMKEIYHVLVFQVRKKNCFLLQILLFLHFKSVFEKI